MTTVASPQILKLRDEIIRIGGQHGRDERFSGSIGDAAHKTHPSSHIGYRDVKAKFGLGAYTLDLPDNRRTHANNRDDAAAIDMSSKQNSDLAVVIDRMHRMAVQNPKALRAMRVYEFAGPDGHGGVFAMSLGRDGKYHRTYGWDPSHKTHAHIGFLRLHTRSRRIPQVAQFWRGL